MPLVWDHIPLFEGTRKVLVGTPSILPAASRSSFASWRAQYPLFKEYIYIYIYMGTPLYGVPLVSLHLGVNR